MLPSLQTEVANILKDNFMHQLLSRPVISQFVFLMNISKMKNYYHCFTLVVTEEHYMQSQIAKFMGPTWGPPGSCRPQMGPMMAPWTLLSGRVFGSTTLVTRVSLTDMRNINNPALQAERLVLFSDKSNLFYQGHTGLRSRTVRCQ